MADGFRVEALERTGLLDTPAEDRFDRLTRLARRALGVEIALITLVDADRQWFKSKDGLTACETDRSVAFCDHAIRRPDEVMIVPDARLDPRFQHNPLVLGEPRIAFYAGAPLTTKEGHALGTLCVIESRPRHDFGPDDTQILRDLARSAMIEIELAARDEQVGDLSIVVNELKHRMGNMYAHVASMISLIGKSEEDKSALVRRLRQQISSFGQSQALLSASGQESAPLADLIATIMGPFRTSAQDERISVNIETPHAVSPRGVFLLTLVLGELATNAVKHGALKGLDGRIEISVTGNPDGSHALGWTEIGADVVRSVPTAQKGYGSTILNQIAPRSVGGSALLTHDQQGLSYVLTMDPEIVFVPG